MAIMSALADIQADTQAILAILGEDDDEDDEAEEVDS